MRHLKTLAVTMAVIVGLPVLLTGAATGRTTTPDMRIPTTAFRDVVLPVESQVAPEPRQTAPPRRTSASESEVILDLVVPAPVVVVERPSVKQPVRIVVETKAGVASAPKTGKARARGTATWYCRAGISVCHYRYPDRRGVADMYAAAGPALRVGKWRGRIVTVCDSNSCIRVKLVDWCACHKGTTGRIIDLYWDAFHALDPDARGGISVTVRW